MESRPDNPHPVARTPTPIILSPPISLLPTASKVFEKLLLKRLLPLVEHAYPSVRLPTKALLN
jgi:hypothetical protein